MTEKILIFGNGQIGNFYQNFFSQKGVASQISLANINLPAEIEKDVDQYQPTVIINTAAATNLEWCAQNKLATFETNVLGTDNLAHLCDQRGIYFVHISSGCIFASKDENDAKKEADLPAPISYYSWTKWWGEQMITFKKSPDFKYLILRPRQPVSAQISAKNMLVKMLTFSKFIDVPNSGTVIEDWMEWTFALLQKKPVGIFHLANEGWTTPYRIGLMLKKYVLPSLPVEKITKEELNRLTPERRVDTILDSSKLKSLGVTVKPFEQRLEEIIQQLAKNIKAADKDFLEKEFEETAAQTKTRTIPNEVWPQLLK